MSEWSSWHEMLVEEKHSRMQEKEKRQIIFYWLSRILGLLLTSFVVCIHCRDCVCLDIKQSFFLLCAWFLFLFFFDAPVNSSIIHLPLLFLVQMKCPLPICLVWQTLKSIKMQFYFNSVFPSMGLLKYIANQYRFHIGLPAEQGWKAHYRKMD